MALLQQAKARIDTPIKVIPVEASYGSPGRVLSFGSLPNFLCKVVPIQLQNVDNVDSIEAALRAWLDPWSIPDSRWAEEFILGSWMGCDVKHLHDEDQDVGVVFR